jgi:hypothetical protein
MTAVSVVIALQTRQSTNRPDFLVPCRSLMSFGRSGVCRKAAHQTPLGNDGNVPLCGIPARLQSTKILRSDAMP